MSTQPVVVSVSVWVHVKNGGRWLWLGSSAVEVSGLLRATETYGPVVHKKGLCQGFLGSEQVVLE